MCGILGAFNSVRIDTELFNLQLSEIKHRGPDDYGVWLNDQNTLALGSRRLAIQDLSGKGHMPMKSVDGKFVIIFNGEIYNYRSLNKELERAGFHFKGHSDTETVLYSYMLWGKNCLEHLSGMFAIAIFDSCKQELFIARDRAGEEPVYYWVHDKGIEFGSELKSLLKNSELPRHLNPVALYQFLENGYSRMEECFIKDVKRLPPAHYLVYNISTQKLNCQRYWEIPAPNKFPQVREEDLVEKLDELLSNSVKQQLISDVPVGILLSGGLDSSLVTAYAAENSHSQIKTFNISFKGFGKYDESKYAKHVADYFNTDHIELSGNEISFDMIDTMLDYYDEPLADSSILPTFLVSQLTKQHVTVALGGDGGDELFGGYSNYLQILKMQRMKKILPDIITDTVGSAFSYLPIGIKGRNYLMSFKGTLHSSFLLNRIFDERNLYKVLTPKYRNYVRDNIMLYNNVGLTRTDDIVYDITRYDFENYMTEDVLVKVDRASMASSLEMRAPWLDKDIIEFAFAKVPSKYKVSASQTKILPKMLASKKLPKNFEINRKQGFSIPLNDWIRNKWFHHFEREINEMPEELFNKIECMKLLKNEQLGFSNSHRLLSLILLSKWLKKYKITI